MNFFDLLFLFTGNREKKDKRKYKSTSGQNKQDGDRIVTDKDFEMDDEFVMEEDFVEGDSSSDPPPDSEFMDQISPPRSKSSIVAERVISTSLWIIFIGIVVGIILIILVFAHLPQILEFIFSPEN